MKVIIGVLVSIGLTICEVPPPYSPRGFRPSPPFNLPIRQPQTTYGVPNGPQSTITRPSSPQTQYGVPNQQGTRPIPNLTPSFSSKQRVPSFSYGVPAATSSPYRTIINEPQVSSNNPNQLGIGPISNLNLNFKSKQTIPPSTSYGVPVTSSQTITNQPQKLYGVPNNENRPSSQYGVPEATNLEALEQIRQLNLLLQLSQSSKLNQQKQIESNRNVEVPSQQYLPIKEAANFKSNLLSQFQNSEQNAQRPTLEYLPVKEPTNFRNGFNLQSNAQDGFDVRISNTNLQQPSDQYLPANRASNFPQGIEFSQTVIPQRNAVNNPISSLERPSIQPNINFEQSFQNPQSFNTNLNFQNEAKQNQQSVTNKNINLSSQNINPNLNTYNAPRQHNVEIERLNVRRLQNSDTNENNNVQIPTRQNVRQPTLNQGQPNTQLGGSNIQDTIKERLNEQYLPPTSTVRTIFRSTPNSASTPSDVSSEEEQPTESNEEAGGPNIAVATAVAGAPGGQSFYLLQPDGRLQRVIYQKTRTEGDRENEYTSNYNFQNIQAVPGLVYSPLISLGKR